jgi:hypothetical protein
MASTQMRHPISDSFPLKGFKPSFQAKVEQKRNKPSNRKKRLFLRPLDMKISTSKSMRGRHRGRITWGISWGIQGFKFDIARAFLLLYAPWAANPQTAGWPYTG